MSHSVSPPAVDARVVIDEPRFEFDNTYARELPGFYANVWPEPAESPTLLRINHPLAAELRLDLASMPETVGAALFSGSACPAGAEPIAQAYAGHQFGGFSPQLGDGRAVLLGELIDVHGHRRDIALKGSGRTPFSRRGDGKAALGPVLREYLIGEAMHALGIPSTRALAAALTGEPVFRDPPQPGAVLTRVAASHLRVGTFQFFAAREEHDKVGQLVHYAIARHYPALAGADRPALALLDVVCDAQAALIAAWMQVGFIHGVMNTDNMTISGETIDYGPCAFLDVYDPQTVFSSIDHQGRYAYVNQPAIAQWNLARLAEALLPLIDPDPDQAVGLATPIVTGFRPRYQAHWLTGMRAKLGLSTAQADDASLIERLLTSMAQQRCDFTLTFRALGSAAAGEGQPLNKLLGRDADGQAWIADWRSRLTQETLDEQTRAAAMNRVNPLFIPRNHQVEAASRGGLAAQRPESVRPTAGRDIPAVRTE